MSSVLEGWSSPMPQYAVRDALKALRISLSTVSDPEFDACWKVLDVEACRRLESQNGAAYAPADPMRCRHDELRAPCPWRWDLRMTTGAAAYGLDELWGRTDALIALANRIGAGFPLARYRDGRKSKARTDKGEISFAEVLGRYAALEDEDEAELEEDAPA